MTLWIWTSAALLYAAFMAWFRNWRGPLSPAEVDRLVARIAAANPSLQNGEEVEALRAFLASDDGREFFMFNLVKLSPTPVIDPRSGAARQARDVLKDYTRMFVWALFRRAGYPAFVARKSGPYLDAWGAPPDPGWTILGLMRYRSRRDLAELVADPRFSSAHASKIAAIPITFSFPSQPLASTLIGPAQSVALGLSLVAALIDHAI